MELPGLTNQPMEVLWNWTKKVKNLSKNIPHQGCPRVLQQQCGGKSRKLPMSFCSIVVIVFLLIVFVIIFIFLFSLVTIVLIISWANLPILQTRPYFWHSELPFPHQVVLHLNFVNRHNDPDSCNVHRSDWQPQPHHPQLPHRQSRRWRFRYYASSWFPPDPPTPGQWPVKPINVERPSPCFIFRSNKTSAIRSN